MINGMKIYETDMRVTQMWFSNQNYGLSDIIFD